MPGRLLPIALLGLAGVVLGGGCRNDAPAPVPATIVGGSMAPSFLGEHLAVNCPDCGATLRCDPEQARQRQHLVCGNCGFDRIDPASTGRQPAQLLEVDRRADVQRWDVVAFQRPDGQLGVKRVVGLPGERIDIRQGKLWRWDGQQENWQPLTRDREQQAAMAVLVHDTRWTPELPLWQFDEPTGWDVTPAGWNWRGSAGGQDAPEAWQWLRFVPRRCYATQLQAPPLQIEDSYAFNQNLPRDLHTVDALRLEVWLRAGAGSQLAVRTLHCGRLINVCWTPGTGDLAIEGLGAEPVLAKTPIPVGDPVTRLGVSTFDGMLSVQVGSWSLAPLPLLPGDLEGAGPPVALGARQGPLNIQRIRLWRDLYFYRQAGGGAAPGPLEAGSGYLLLGDNQPLSFDSRHWTPASVPAAAILGVVKRPASATEEASREP